jgi:hypothetical protein
MKLMALGGAHSMPGLRLRVSGNTQGPVNSSSAQMIPHAEPVQIDSQW